MEITVTGTHTLRVLAIDEEGASEKAVERYENDNLGTPLDEDVEVTGTTEVD